MKSLISDKVYGFILMLFGITGLASTAYIHIEKAKIAEDAKYQTICTINETFSCNDVMASWQASTFGFPNTYIGFVGFGITIAIGLLYLLSTRIFSEKTPPQWILWGNLVGFTLAMAFVFFLAHAAIFEIHALCIFCMIIWFSVNFLLFSTVSKIFKYTHVQNLILISIMVALFTGVMYYELG